MKTVEVYKPFIGTTTYGKGVVRKTTPKLDKGTIYKFVFVSEDGGCIYFNELSEWQMRGMIFTEKLTTKHLDIL